MTENTLVLRNTIVLTLLFQINMSTDLFAESLFLIGDRLIWSIFSTRSLSLGKRNGPLTPFFT